VSDLTSLATSAAKLAPLLLAMRGGAIPHYGDNGMPGGAVDPTADQGPFQLLARPTLDAEPPAQTDWRTGVATDNNTIPAEHFTFSTMVLPAGCEGPLHLHTDAEEVFFIMRGERVRIMIEHLGEHVDIMLKERDVISVPPGVYRGLVNEGREEALMCVMIGSTKPETPSYPPDHPLSMVKRNKA
jgi:mannose-6-phosphate isomerase-like protein (cupin superfamily)